MPSGHVIPLSEISLCGPILQMGKMRLKRSDLPAALAGSAHRGGHAEREKTRPGSTQTSSQVGRGLEDRAGCPGRGVLGGASRAGRARAAAATSAAQYPSRSESLSLVSGDPAPRAWQTGGCAGETPSPRQRLPAGAGHQGKLRREVAGMEGVAAGQR